jgi:hypothetical protein
MLQLRAQYPEVAEVVLKQEQQAQVLAVEFSSHIGKR